MTTPRQGSLGRLHDLDAMRSVLMLLGILLHGANPYRPQTTWLVRDSSSSPVLTWLVDFVHLFRMPGFFVVAGFFAMLSLSRRTTAQFLSERLTRLLIPCATTLLVLNVPQTLFLARDVPTNSGWAGTLSEAWFDGRLVGHLWFLIDLALFLLVVAFLATFIRRMLGHQVNDDTPPWWTVPAMVGIGVAWAVLVAVMDFFGPPWMHQQVGGLINPVEWLSYAPFFASGLVLFHRPKLLRSFSTLGWLDTIVAIAALAVWLTLRETNGMAAAVAIATNALVSWYLVRACFAAFQRWASRPSVAFRYLSDASYTVYLVHHVVVVVVATLLLPANLPAMAKFLLVVLTASVLPLGVYHFLVRPSPIMRFLFNGKQTPAVRA